MRTIDEVGSEKLEPPLAGTTHGARHRSPDQRTSVAGAGGQRFAGRADVPVVHTDDFASWDDQFGWGRSLRAQVIEPLMRGEPGRYQRYDWLARRFGEWHEVPVADVVIVEGVGAAQRLFADAIAMTVWVETPPDVRLARGIARDGQESREFWQQWVVGEWAHFAADGTSARADLVVIGDPNISHDPEREFVAAD